MDPSRYELLAEIARGDFAVVYRGRDRELGREVAIKQIHQQYLHDSHTLERFWREAQLLASLEHPNIMNIYDMVRSRGWLILELMPASLAQYAHGEPLDLDLLRVALSCSLQALQYLHANGIVHGDIKPSNLFVDKRLWVKVGDFGLARRASNEQGSMLKGTTRYMAPELVSAQFGPVGPASDLYSLGFSAYELMCGSQFDALFPGLEAFGRDKQIAWMMWHAAPDRRLPPINRVLADVPDDLRHVIQRLVAKNPAERYKSAAEALADLKSRLQLKGDQEDEESEEELAAAAKAQKRKRLLLIGAGAMFSCVLSLAMLVMSGPAKPLPPKPLADPILGVVRNLLTDKHTLVIEKLADHTPKEVVVQADDRLFLNGAPSLLRDIEEGDKVTLKEAHDEHGKIIHEFYCDRPDRSRGVLASVDPDSDSLTVDLDKPNKAGKKTLIVSVPADLPIRFNNREKWQDKPIKLADLLPGDTIVVDHDGKDDDRRATALSVMREVPLEGYLRSFDLSQGASADEKSAGQLTIAVGAEKDDKAPLETWPIDPKCVVTINGQRLRNGALIKLGDLEPGVEVTIQHDTHVRQIAAQKTFRQKGILETVRADKGNFDMTREGENRPTLFIVAKDCKIRLGDEAVALSELHHGDDLSISFDSLDSNNTEVLAISAIRRPDPLRWGVVVGEQAFDDKGVSLLPYAGADARLVADTLVKRYQVPPEQLLMLLDDPKARWEERLPPFFAKVPADGRLVVYYVGHGYADKSGKIWLAPRDFALARPDATGYSLQEFVGLMEKSPVKDKLLLLDATHAGGADAKQEPSSAEMIQTLLEPGALSPVKTVTVIASCSAGQRAQDERTKNHGRFAMQVAAGLAGKADKEQENRVDAAELAEFLTASFAGSSAPQTPVLILPDNTPPRLTEEAKTAIRKLASNLLVPRFDMKKAEEEYAAAQQLAEKQPEPKLIYGLVLLKAKKEPDALHVFEELKPAAPDSVVPPMASAFLHFRKQDITSGILDLQQLLGKLTPSGDGAQEGKFEIALASWAGRVREYATAAAPEQRRPAQGLVDALDATAQQLPAACRQGYDQGRQHVRKMLATLDKEIADNVDQAEQLRMQVKRKQLTEYVSFPLEALSRRVLDGMQEPGRK